MPAPGLSGFRTAREDMRTEQAHGLEMQTSQATLDQMLREADEWEANQKLRNKQRKLEEQQTRHQIDNFQEIADMEMQQMRAETSQALGDAQQSQIKAVNMGNEFMANNLPEDISNMSQRELNRVRRQATQAGLDPDSLGLPERMNTQAYLDLAQRRDLAVNSVQQERDRMNIWEQQRAQLWRSQREYDHALANPKPSDEQNPQSPRGKLIYDRNQLIQQRQQAEQQGDMQTVARLNRDIELYDEQLASIGSEGGGPSQVLGEIYRRMQTVGVNNLTENERKIIEIHANANNPFAHTMYQNLQMGDDLFSLSEPMPQGPSDPGDVPLPGEVDSSFPDDSEIFRAPNGQEITVRELIDMVKSEHNIQSDDEARRLLRTDSNFREMFPGGR